VKSGEGFSMSGAGSNDPDGDSLSYYWFQYIEAGSYKTPVTIGAETLSSIYVVAPQVEKTETLHFILRVTDKGTPPLSRYKRIIVMVAPS
jgi:hypothetical protein